MELTANAIAKLINGKIDGNKNVLITKISKIESGEKGSISFLANPHYSKFIYSTKSSVVLVNKDFNPENKITCTLIRVDDAYQAFAQILEYYNQQKSEKIGVEETASVAFSAKICDNTYVGAFTVICENVTVGKNSKIYPQVYIGENVTVGENTIIYPGVKIYPECKIGNNCIIHAGVIIGSDGFGFAPQSDNEYKKVQQIGNVILEDNVEIGANTTVDRATLGSTIIKKGVKLDNLIQIGHNVELGNNTVIAALTGISGSTKLGKNCVIGGQVGFVGHIKVADGVKVAAQSGVTKAVKKANVSLQGTPAFPLMDSQRSNVFIRKLPDLNNRISILEKKIEELTKLKS